MEVDSSLDIMLLTLTLASFSGGMFNLMAMIISIDAKSQDYNIKEYETDLKKKLGKPLYYLTTPGRHFGYWVYEKYSEKTKK